jgi:S-adenosylmethionine synthetase
VAAELAERCTIQLSYAIGIAEPLSVYIGLHGTGRISEEVLGDAIRSLVDLTPKGIRKHLSLNRPIYEQTAAYGHFGRSPTENGGFSWEKTDLVTDLLDAIKTPRVSKTYSCA